MIAHVILFSPREDLSSAARRELLDALVAASAGIPSIRRFRVGRRIKHGLPGYEQMMRDDYEFAAIVEFDDVDALKTYLAHPSHATIGRHFTASASRALAYDYALVDAGDVAQLVE
jgi:hypothetical protein